MKKFILPEISVVILCYKSGQFARIFYKRVSDVLAKNNLDYEIVLVGNYRPNTGDKTPEVIKEIASSNPRVKAVIKEKTCPEEAMGWDMRSGLEVANGKTITVIDGDGQMPPEDIPRLISTIMTDFHKNPERQSFISFKANFEFVKNIIRWRIKEFKR